MEATGCYHLQLAIFLYEEGICVSVVNPLQIKRFSQMKLHKLKTDKADARIIAQYGANYIKNNDKAPLTYRDYGNYYSFESFIL